MLLHMGPLWENWWKNANNFSPKRGFGNAHSQPSNFTIMDSSVEKTMWSHLLIIVSIKNSVKLWQRLFVKLCRELIAFKGQDHLGPRLGILADFWVLHEIDSWNFQYLWFSEASQNLSSFRQLLFSLFHCFKGKNSKKQWIFLAGILNFYPMKQWK